MNEGWEPGDVIIEGGVAYGPPTEAIHPQRPIK